MRTLSALWLAKASGAASRRLGRGGGTALTGLVGLALQPALIGELVAQLEDGSVFISGTNGKTTTAALLSQVAREAGRQPLANSSGSNLRRGLASAMCAESDLRGRLQTPEARLGVFEVDEASLPGLLSEVRPRVLVLLNLFRDQLDRYGEVDAVSDKWRTAIASRSATLHLVLNADDPAIALIGEGREDVTYFGLNDPRAGNPEMDHASDSLICTCGGRLAFEMTYFSHLGHWSCPSCGRARPKPTTSASEIDLTANEGLAFTLRSGQDESSVRLSLAGLYNVYNALAAAAAGQALGLTFDSCIQGLSGASSAFGRQELFQVEDRRVELLLAKNPTGLNQVMATVSPDEEGGVIMLALNDGIADGRDISWIWDVDFEKYANVFEDVQLSGDRAHELALRLKYAGWNAETFSVEPGLNAALEAVLNRMSSGSRLRLVPTYTAMLELRELLAQRAGRQPYWSRS